MFIIKLVAESIARTAELRRQRRAAAAAAKARRASTSESDAVDQEVSENGGDPEHLESQESSEDEGYLDLETPNSLLDRISYMNPKEQDIKRGTDSILYNLVSGREDVETASLRSRLVKLSTEPYTDEEQSIRVLRRPKRKKPRQPVRRSGDAPSSESSVEPGSGLSSSSSESFQSTSADGQVPSTSHEQLPQQPTDQGSSTATGDAGWRRKRHRYRFGGENSGKMFIYESDQGAVDNNLGDEPLDLSSTGLKLKEKSFTSQFPLLEKELFSTDERDTVVTIGNFSTLPNASVEPSTSRANQPIRRQPYNSYQNVEENSGLHICHRRETNGVGSLDNNVHYMANILKFLLTPFGMATTIATMLATKPAMPHDITQGQTTPGSDLIGQPSEEQLPLVALMRSLLAENIRKFASYLSSHNTTANGIDTTQLMPPTPLARFNGHEPGVQTVFTNGLLMDTCPGQMPVVGNIITARNGGCLLRPQVSSQEMQFKLPMPRLGRPEISTIGVVSARAGNGAMDVAEDNEEEGNNSHILLGSANRMGLLSDPRSIGSDMPLEHQQQPPLGSTSAANGLLPPVVYAISKVQSYLFSLTELILKPKESLTNDLRQWRRAERESVPQATVRTFATFMLKLMEMPILNRVNLLKISWHRLLMLYILEDDRVYVWFRESISNAWRVESDAVKAVVEQIEEVHQLVQSLKRNSFVFQMLRVGLLLLGEKGDFSGDPIVRQMEETLYQDSMEQNNHLPTAGVIPQVLVTAQCQLRELIKFRACLALLGNLDQEATGHLFRAVFKQPITVFSKVLTDLN